MSYAAYRDWLCGWGAEPKYTYHPRDDFEPADEYECPGKPDAEMNYDPDTSPLHNWKAYKFDMDERDITGILWDKYNTIRMPMLSLELFLLDVRHAADEADTREAFEAKLLQRKRERAEEAYDCFALAAGVQSRRLRHGILGAAFELSQQNKDGTQPEAKPWETGFDLFLKHKDLSSLAMMFGNIGKIGRHEEEMALAEEGGFHSCRDAACRARCLEDLRNLADVPPCDTAAAKSQSPVEAHEKYAWRVWRGERAKLWRGEESSARRTTKEQSAHSQNNTDDLKSPLPASHDQFAKRAVASAPDDVERMTPDSASAYPTTRSFSPPTKAAEAPTVSTASPLSPPAPSTPPLSISTLPRSSPSSTAPGTPGSVRESPAKNAVEPSRQDDSSVQASVPLPRTRKRALSSLDIPADTGLPYPVTCDGHTYGMQKRQCHVWPDAACGKDSG